MVCMQANVGEVSTASVACGVLGVGGNKGGVAVSFTLYRRRLCCVSSHFAAHQVLLLPTCCPMLVNKAIFCDLCMPSDTADTALRTIDQAWDVHSSVIFINLQMTCAPCALMCHIRQLQSVREADYSTCLSVATSMSHTPGHTSSCMSNEHQINDMQGHTTDICRDLCTWCTGGASLCPDNQEGT